MRALVHIPYFLTVACAPGAEGGSHEAGEADRDADAGPCPAYTGFARVGTNWVYRDADEAHHWNATETITELTSTSVELNRLTESAGDGITNIDSVYRYRCDAEGLWLLSHYGEETTTWGAGTEQWTWAETIYELPVLEIPAGLAVGSAWDAVYGGLTRTPDGETTFDYTLSNEALDEGSVTVPAGTYTALRVRQVSAHADSHDRWYDRSVGFVTSYSSDLVSYSP